MVPTEAKTRRARLAAAQREWEDVQRRNGEAAKRRAQQARRSPPAPFLSTAPSLFAAQIRARTELLLAAYGPALARRRMARS
jgi:hypothetical protein